MSDEPTSPVRAGAAYLAATENDPAAREAWVGLRTMAQGIVDAAAPLSDVLVRWRTAFDAFGERFRPELETVEAERQRAFAELAAELRHAVSDARADLAAHGFEAGWDDLEDWERLARTVERDPGPMTVREIYQWAIAWADREAFRIRLTRKLASPDPPPAPPAERLVEVDRLDPALARVVGHRVYLGHDTQVARLFWLLAQPLGRRRSLVEVQDAIDGMITDPSLGMDADECRRAAQRVRKVLSRLRVQLAEHGADTYLTITRVGGRDDPGFFMAYNPGGTG